MGAKIQAFDIFQTPLNSHYPLPLKPLSSEMDPAEIGLIRKVVIKERDVECFKKNSPVTNPLRTL